MSFDAVGIVSEDIESSVKFYKLLGVTFKAIDSSEHLEAMTPSGVRIMLDSLDLIKEINPQWKKSSGSGVILCFKVNSPEQVDRLYKKVIEAGFQVSKAPWNAFWGQRYCSVLDPDQNQVDIFASL